MRLNEAQGGFPTPRTCITARRTHCECLVVTASCLACDLFEAEPVLITLVSQVVQNSVPS